MHLSGQTLILFTIIAILVAPLLFSLKTESTKLKNVRSLAGQPASLKEKIFYFVLVPVIVLAIILLKYRLKLH